MDCQDLRKDPDAVLDFGVDWEPWLQSSEVITTSQWIVTPVGLTVDSHSHNGSKTTVWLSAGVLGKNYSVTNRITTDQGRTDDRTLWISVKNR